MGLRSKFLSTILADLPDSSSVIHDTDSRFDALMGGKIAKGKWKRYEYPFGTNCLVTLVGWLIDAGAPADMLNAEPPEGAGFTPGAHGTKLIAGAKSRGWYKTPVKGQLPDFRPGDIFLLNHGNGNNTHGGAVVSVTPSADGQSLSVETADGGQGTRTDQEITRQTRTFTIGSGAHAVEYSAKLVNGNTAYGLYNGGGAIDYDNSVDVSAATATVKLCGPAPGESQSAATAIRPAASRRRRARACADGRARAA